ncbi:uncharacterized protein LOC130378690 isoform X2 [Gadus chalcogrammus]|nr:uncharacterized protein LOC130378690 isoform X2 [Gadus chalcogrammus]
MSSLSSNSSGLRPVERTTTEEDQESESQLTRGRSRTWTKDHESASSHPRKGVSRPVKKRTPTEDHESDTSQPEERKKNDSSRKKRKMWSKEEIQAVEQELMHSIKTGKVPGKAQCLECIRAFPEALKGRTWDAVKYYVKNRIDAWKRQSMSH